MSSKSNSNTIKRASSLRKLASLVKRRDSSEENPGILSENYKSSAPFHQNTNIRVKSREKQSLTISKVMQVAAPLSGNDYMSNFCPIEEESASKLQCLQVMENEKRAFRKRSDSPVKTIKQHSVASKTRSNTFFEKPTLSNKSYLVHNDSENDTNSQSQDKNKKANRNSHFHSKRSNNTLLRHASFLQRKTPIDGISSVQRDNRSYSVSGERLPLNEWGKTVIQKSSPKRTSERQQKQITLQEEEILFSIGEEEDERLRIALLTFLSDSEENQEYNAGGINWDPYKQSSVSKAFDILCMTPKRNLSLSMVTSSTAALPSNPPSPTLSSRMRTINSLPGDKLSD